MVRNPRVPADYISSTAVMMRSACTLGSDIIVRMMIASGADVNATMHIPLEETGPESVSLVFLAAIRSGADGVCPTEASRYQRVVKLLLDNGADPDFLTIAGRNALAVCLCEKWGMVRVLVAGGADIEKHVLGRLPLHQLVAMNNLALVRFLLASGANLDSRAVLTDMDAEAVADMEAGADDNDWAPATPMNEWGTALEQAAQDGNLIMVKVLVEAGASVSIRAISAARTGMAVPRYFAPGELGRQEKHQCGGYQYAEVIAYLERQAEAEECWDDMISCLELYEPEARALVNGVCGERVLFTKIIRRTLRVLKKRGDWYGDAENMDFHGVMAVTADAEVMVLVCEMLLCENCLAFHPSKACGKCRRAKYCDTECQRQDFSGHRSVCEPCPDFLSVGGLANQSGAPQILVS
jgi:hypothetical protein